MYQDYNTHTTNTHHGIVHYTCHMIRVTRIRYYSGVFLCDTAVLHFDTDFS